MRNPRFTALLSFMGELHDSKNADYASDGNPYSNFEEAAQTAAGFSGVDVVFASLIGVKLARLRELTRAGKTPNHEGIQDTRRDLAMYATLWASYHEPAVRDSGILNTATIPPTAMLSPDDKPAKLAPRPRPTYDDLRGPDLQPCRCGRLYTHPEACDTAEKCLALDHPHAK